MAKTANGNQGFTFMKKRDPVCTQAPHEREGFSQGGLIVDRLRQPPDVEAAENRLNYNAPLRSVRGDGAAPSHFYKLSSELSRESLRAPGAVPFVWEQTPGRRKPTASGEAYPPPSPPPPETPASQPAKRTLAALFRQPSLEAADFPYSVPSNIPPITAPPTADHPRCSRGPYSVVQHTPPPLVSNDGDAASDANSDAVTATVGDLSVDASLISGAVQPSTSTASDTRDFIMHRFLPAAHAIAWDTPQMPSRRFVPPVSRSSVDARPSPLRYAATPTKKALSARALPLPLIRSQGASLNDGDGDDDDDDDEQPVSMRACGMFSFRIRNALLQFHRSCASPSRSKQQNKKSNKISLGPRRLIDILSEETSYDDDQDQRLWSQQLEEKARKMVVVDCAMPPCNPPIATNRGSPLLQLMVLDDESSNYYDAPSSFRRGPVGGTIAEAKLSPLHAETRSLTQLAINYDTQLAISYDLEPNPAHSASALTCNFDTPQASMSGESGDSVFAEQNPLVNHHILAQIKPQLNNAIGHDREIIKGINWPTPILFDRVAIPSSRLSAIQKWQESMGDYNCKPSSPGALLSPPLPKSPTQSWLGRAIPLSAKGRSPLSHMHSAAHPKKENSPEDPKWEAIVKGSHVQPGHLRFSEELLHQSHNATMKVGAA